MQFPAVRPPVETGPVSNSVAIWGAVTGTIGTLTGLGGLALTVHNTRRDRKRDLRVSHGWQYAYDEAGNLLDVWVNVTAFNTGRRPLHIEYIGFETMVVADRSVLEGTGIDLPDENNVWVNQRFEIALNGETLDVVPDGPSVKVWTSLPPLCAAIPIDPTTTPVRGYVVSWPEQYWWEPGPSPLLAEPSQVHRTMTEVGEAVAHLVIAEAPGRTFDEPPDRPGNVLGLQRLILDGSTERTSDLLRGRDRGTS